MARSPGNEDSDQSGTTAKKPFRLLYLFPALPVLLITFGVAAYAGTWPLPFSVDLLSSGMVSVGGLTAGFVSVGFASTGLISFGVFSSGLISIGVFSTGTLAIGIWAAGRYATVPILVSFWQRKFAGKAYRAEGGYEVLDILKPALDKKPEALFYDLACGSGNLSRGLMQTEWFIGEVRAVDASQTMLTTFQDGLDELPADKRARITFRLQDLRNWKPEVPERATAVALLEVSEMISFLPELLRETYAALSPGGTLVLTRSPAPFSWYFPGSRQSRKGIADMLNTAGYSDIEFRPWTWRYEFVVARKLDT